MDKEADRNPWCTSWFLANEGIQTHTQNSYAILGFPHAYCIFRVETDTRCPKEELVADTILDGRYKRVNFPMEDAYTTAYIDTVAFYWIWLAWSAWLCAYLFVGSFVSSSFVVIGFLRGANMPRPAAVSSMRMDDSATATSASAVVEEAKGFI